MIKPFRVLTISSILALSLMTSFGITTSIAASNLGKPCSKIGAQIGDGPNRTLICQKRGAKKIWQLLKQPSTTTNSASIPGQSANSNTPSPGAMQSCSSRPTFTHDLIDPKFVRDVTPIGGQTGGGGVVAVRSYIHPSSVYTGQQLPIYAPTDMQFYGASYYKPATAAANYQPEYGLYFHLGCNLDLQLFHIKGVVGNVAMKVPTTPTASSASQDVPPTSIKAGEQIGWYKISEGSVAFDFWVNDYSHTNSFIVQSHFLESNALHSICPYDLYTPEKKAVWLAKLGAPGSDPVPGTTCGVVQQGKLGSADGMWFFSQDTKTDALTFDGAYQSQIMLSTDPSGMVRIGGLAANRNFVQMMIGSNSVSYGKPEDIIVGQEHCWSDSNQSVKVSVVSNMAMKVVVGQGSCDVLPDFSQGKVYVR